MANKGGDGKPQKPVQPSKPVKLIIVDPKTVQKGQKPQPQPDPKKPR